MTKTATALLAAAALAIPVLTTGTGALAAGPRDAASDSLLQQVPAGLRPSCQPASPPSGLAATLVCKPRHVAATRVVVDGYADPASATARYLHDGDRHGIPRDTAGDCFSYIDSESPFRTKTGVTGRVFCAHKDRSIEWTDGTVVARATGTNPNDLYTWWARLVGRTLNPVQQALYAQVPAGIDRTNCQDNGDTSIKCTSPAADVYVARYTRFASPDALTAAYGSALTGAKVTGNTPPPKRSKQPCPFETTWGPTSGSATLGHVACFHAADGTYHFLWTTDSQMVLVDADGPSLSDMTQFFKAFAAADQTSSPRTATG